MVEHLDERAVAMTVSEAWASYVEVAAVDPKTMSLYESVFAHHVEPVLGRRPIAGVTRADVEALLGGMRAGGAGPALVRHGLRVLAVVSRRARALGAISELPTAGVSSPRPDAPPPRVLTPQEFVRMRDALPTAGARLLAELLVRSGLRVGEALALTPADVVDDVVLVRRCLSEPGRRFSADGQRFVLRPSTKNGEPRRVVVGVDLGARVRAWCALQDAEPEGLVFPARLVLPEPSGRSFPRTVHAVPLTPERLAELGTFTGPNGLVYQHGTMNGYVTGRCRGACCRQAISEYSAARRRERRERLRADGVPRRAPVLGPAGAGASGEPPGLGVVSPQAWAKVWATAVDSAGLDFSPLARQTRHAHASWLNDGGVSVEQIAARLGHRDERSTRGYVRPVGSEPDPVVVLDALLGGGGSPPEQTGAVGL